MKWLKVILTEETTDRQAEELLSYLEYGDFPQIVAVERYDTDPESETDDIVSQGIQNSWLEEGGE